jgi:rhodanese-related sulfurtransferase
MTSTLPPAGLKLAVENGDEFALLDTRTPKDFQAGHLLLSVNTPVSQLPDMVGRLVPRLNTQIVLYDGGTREAGLTAVTLEEMGYGNLHILQGGTSDLAAQGFQMFEGTYTINNAFSIAAETFYGTPRMTAETLQARLADGENLYIIDSRPFEEFHSATIPGANNIPVVELIRHINALEQTSASDIVVICGGRARAVFGAQSLINGGIRKPVHALYYGTMGWDMAGLALMHGSNAMTGPGHGDTTFDQRVDSLAQRFSVPTIERTLLEAWIDDSDGRTLYLIDVRTQKEFGAGHIPGSRWVSGGELVGLTEDHLATRNARVCLVDDNGLRATLTASWMLQMGWSKTVVLKGGTTAWSASELERSDHSARSDVSVAGDLDDSLIPPSGPEVYATYGKVIAYREQLPEQMERDGSLTFRFPATKR